MNFNMKKLDSITAVLLFALALFSLMAFTTYKARVITVIEIEPKPIKILQIEIKKNHLN